MHMYWPEEDCGNVIALIVIVSSLPEMYLGSGPLGATYNFLRMGLCIGMVTYGCTHWSKYSKYGLP